jgi:hypothetical protein
MTQFEIGHGPFFLSAGVAQPSAQYEQYVTFAESHFSK